MNNDRHIYTIFGASGDLTKRKLIPALYSLYLQNLLPDKYIILGAARSRLTDDDFRNIMRESIQNSEEIEDKSLIDDFLVHLFYINLDYNNYQDYIRLKRYIEELRTRYEIPGNSIFYLSTPPSLYRIIPVNLAAAGLNTTDDGWKRLIIEKPFGFDLASSIELKDILLKDWKEEQIFRIDHYLGKETVQNVLVTRFSNGIFEPLWNRNYIHHIEVTAAENIGIENRGGYYDTIGALRDMIQNHLLQLVGLIAMEPPSSLEPLSIRNEILKVFQSLRPIRKEDITKFTVRGQYVTSVINNEVVKGYREENNIKPDSKTETFAAIKFFIDNWRWGGVPFYIRTGKRLPTRVTEVVIHFKPTPHFLFKRNNIQEACNKLILRIQPDEGMLLEIGIKTSGAGFEVQNIDLDFRYSELAHQRIPTAYERLLYDTIRGDNTLFARTEEVIEAWKFLTPILEEWSNNPDVPLYGYPAGTWGPKEADNLFEDENQTWHFPCRNLTNSNLYCEL
ncbi:glucose-6-phosphate dehydrogenase [Melioribacter sp. OK-6-Me]|uniref:glucose-6-phosphate dehydrogenase n=1 Tax=unclassified Melioribacter TaxID=2627329 RepID=UPI003ED93074